MTRLSFATSSRVGQLSLKVIHLLASRQAELSPMDQANSTIKVIKAADVKGIQILPPPSRLVIVVQGNVDGSAVSAKQMCDSAVAKHLLNSLRKNSNAMCIHDVSDITIEDGATTISFSSSHTHSDEPTSPHLVFLSLKLVYTWTSALTEKRNGLDGDTNLGCKFTFNPIMSSRVSPFVELLDKIGHRLLSHHIIRRYPRIFGPCSRAIRREQIYFPIIARSLCSIIGRSRDQPLRSSFLAKIKRLRRENSLHDQLSRQNIDKFVQEQNNLPADHASTHMNIEEPEEWVESFVPTLEQFLTNLYAKGVKPWIKGLHGYSDSSDEDSSNISIFKYPLEDTLADLTGYLDETPELDWTSSPSESGYIDSIDEFNLIQESDVYDEDDFLVCVPDTCEGFAMDMSSAGDPSKARSAGNLATAYHKYLENRAGSKTQYNFSPRNEASLTRNVETIPGDPNLSLADLFVNRVASDSNGVGEEPKWSEMDIEDSSDGISDFSQFECTTSGNKHGFLLGGGLGGQECAVHVNDLLEYESNSEIEWDPMLSQLVDSDCPQCLTQTPIVLDRIAETVGNAVPKSSA